MKSRGFFDLDVIEKLDIRYIEKGRIPFGVKEDGTERTIPVKERIVFPIYIENRAIGWQARDVTGLSDLRYLISSNLPKDKMIYNYENINNSSYITIVEGIIDLIKCFDINPICLLGKTLSNTQLSLLLKLPNLKRIYIAIDRDEEKAINEMGMLLSNFFEVFIIKTKEKDPGECTRMQMVEYKDSAIKFNQDNLNFTLS
jgi:DNA primase